jgi:hypothetical protein
MKVNLNSITLFSNNEAKKKTKSEPEVDNRIAAFNQFYKFQDDLGKIDPYNVAAAYSSIYTRSQQATLGVVEAVDQVSNFYLVDTIINQIADDSLTPDITTNEIVRIQAPSAKKEVQEAINELDRLIDFDQLVLNVTPEIIKYGSYTYETELGKGKQGITDLLDAVEQGSVIQLTKNGAISGYLVYNQNEGKIKRVGPAHYVHFIMAGPRIKVANKLASLTTRNEKMQQLLKKLPSYIRIGRSMVYPLIEKIKELQLLEKLVPATKLSKMSGATLIGMSVPNTQEIKVAMAATRKVEGLINQKVNVDPVSNELTIEDILATTGKMKVVPLFGDKGTLEKLDFKSDEPDDLLGSVTELRTTICDSIGVPYELLYKSDTESKQENLRRHSRYLRRLKNIQRCLVGGLRQLVYIHLANKGISFKKEDIDINFINTLPNLDNLDRLEQADITISALSSMKDMFDGLLEEDSLYKDYVRKDVFLAYVDKNLGTISLEDAIDLEKLSKDFGGQYNTDNGNILAKSKPTDNIGNTPKVKQDKEDDFKPEDVKDDKK